MQIEELPCEDTLQYFQQKRFTAGLCMIFIKPLVLPCFLNSFSFFQEGRISSTYWFSPILCTHPLSLSLWRKMVLRTFPALALPLLTLLHFPRLRGEKDNYTATLACSSSLTSSSTKTENSILFPVLYFAFPITPYFNEMRTLYVH